MPHLDPQDNTKAGHTTLDLAALHSHCTLAAILPGRGTEPVKAEADSSVSPQIVMYEFSRTNIVKLLIAFIGAAPASPRRMLTGRCRSKTQPGTGLSTLLAPCMSRPPTKSGDPAELGAI